MLEFQWNALRVGDRVLMHDDDDPSLALHSGAVSLVQTRRTGANEIGFRLDDHDSALKRPRRHAVHLLPIDAGEGCWRCDALSTTPTGTDRTVAA